MQSHARPVAARFLAALKTIPSVRNASASHKEYCKLLKYNSIVEHIFIQLHIHGAAQHNQPGGVENGETGQHVLFICGVIVSQKHVSYSLQVHGMLIIVGLSLTVHQTLKKIMEEIKT